MHRVLVSLAPMSGPRAVIPGRIHPTVALLAIALLATALHSSRATAETLQTFGNGSAVTQIDRSTTFDNLDFLHNGAALDGYSSNRLAITTNGNNYVGDNALGQVGQPVAANSPYLNPFLLTGPSGPSYSFVGGGYYFPYDSAFGNSDWVHIATTDSTKIYAAEFLYGNGWTNGDVYGTFPWGNSTIPLEWQTYNGAALISSGSVTPGVGSVIGFYDPSGFTELRVRAPGNATNWQEIAIDNLNVQITVPEPSTLAILGIGLGGVILLGRCRRSQRAITGATKVIAFILAAIVFSNHAAPARADTITFFNSAQGLENWASGATSDTVRSMGYQFTYTLDKYWSATGNGPPTGRMTPVTWPAGLDAQTITTGPTGPLSSQIAAQVTITRVDGQVFDLNSFTGKILGNTAGAGASFELMPALGGNDGFPNPLMYDATGYANQSFSYSPNVTGYDTYHLSLWMDYGLTSLTVSGAPTPEPSSVVLFTAGAAILALRRRPAGRDR